MAEKLIIKESPSYTKERKQNDVYKQIDSGVRSYNKTSITKEALEKARRLGKKDRQQNNVVRNVTKRFVKTQAERTGRIATGILKNVAKGYAPSPARGLSSLRQPAPSRQQQIREHFREQESMALPTQVPYHVEMRAYRDNGYRPHETRSLVKEPDVEGYMRNTLLHPPKNIWEEPRKQNVWDETFKKKKSIFDE